MRIHHAALLALLSFVLIVVLSACGDSLPGKCSSYCKKARDCSAELDNPFSISECKRTCEEGTEANYFAGCGEEADDLFQCQIDADCRDWENDPELCEDEEEDLTKCIERYID